MANRDHDAAAVEGAAAEGAEAGKPLTPAARRALEEAAARRNAAMPPATATPAEIGGPKGPEPTRYGDWAFKGRVSDF